MWTGVGRGIRFAGLIDGNYAELIPFAFTESWHARFQLFDGSHAVVVISDERIKPATKFVLFLDDVVTDGATASVLGFGPSQSYRFIIKVYDLRFSRWSRWS